MDNFIARESTDGGHKAQVGEEEELNETVGNLIVEESTDGEHKAQVEEGELLNETMDNFIVEESTGGEHKARVEEEVLNGTVGNDIVEQSTNGECNAQVREEKELNETVVNFINEESTDGEQKAQVDEGESLNETMVDVIVGESTDGELKSQVKEEEVLIKTMGDVIVEQSTDGEQKAQVGEEEELNTTVGNFIVEESTDDEHKAQVEEGELLNETMDNLEQNTDGEHKAQVEEEELLNKTISNVSNVIVEQSIDGKHKAQVREEVLNETMGNAIVEKGIDGEHKAQIGEEDALTETMGNVIVKESTDGKHKAQVGGEEALTETMGNVIVEEITDGEHEAQVREEAFTGTMSNAIVKESTDDEHKAPVREDKVLTEMMGNAIVKQSTDGKHNAQVREEVLTETMGNAIVEESTDGEHKAQVWEEEALKATKGNVIVEESTDGEYKAQVREQEVLNETEKQEIQSMASGTRIILENDQHVSYHLPSLDKANFSFSDLVWGKVKSHPWWPGQIFDPSDASKLAMKYQKEDSFLVTYFGDKTFAWCDESQLKPFHSYFSQFENQCSSDTFLKAVHDIMMEVSRRVELGMACSCLPEENYTNIKYQKIENAGIRGGNINSTINRPTIANYFQPDKLLEYIEALAQFPNGRVDKLEFVIAQSQLKAFYCSKGYPELPEFTVSGGLMDSVIEYSPSSGKGSMEDMVEHCTPVPSDLISAMEKSRSEESSFNKQEHGFEYDVKQKSMSKLTEDGTAVHLANGGKSTIVAKAAEKPISSSSGKKHIIVESDPVDSGRCKKRMLDSFEDIELKSPSPTVTSSFKIGEFIRRAASQLTGASPILKCQWETLQKCGPQAEQMKDDVADFDLLPDSPVENQRTNLSFTKDYYSTDEMLSQLCLAARDPLEEYSFVSTIVVFFTGFRNFCVSSSSEEKEHIEKRKRGRPRKVLSQQAASDISSSEDEKHVEKRKRGRPRKVISQQTASDISSSEDEKHVEKRKRDILKNVISQLASSDVSSEDEKPVQKRKRGRPRKNAQPAPSDSSVQKHKTGRPRGRPRKVDSQLASPDYNSSDNKKPVEMRKRGRPKKLNSEMVPSDMSTLDHMKESYWPDMDLQNKRNDNTHMQYQKKRKSTGEQSLLPPSTLSYIEQQLQLIAMNPNMKHAFVAERSIISVEEKIVDECMPTALILSFNSAHSLPSEIDLIRIFSRYGPLKKAETDVLRKTNHAKVVFKRRVDAETAFSSAGKYSIFGPGLLSYQLKPWTPRSSLQATHQGTQDAESAAMLQDTYDAAHITTPDGNHDAPPITTLPDNHDATPITTPQDNHNAAPITKPQDNHDASLIATPQDEHGSAPIITAQDDHEPITMVQDNHDAAVVITLQHKCDAGHPVGSNLEFSEHAENVIASDTIQVEAEGKESSPHDKHDPALIITRQENQDAVPVASSQDEHDLTPTSTQDNLNAAPINMVEDNHDAAAVITLQDTRVSTLQGRCDAGPAAGSNLELSEQAEDVKASDTIPVKSEGKESAPRDKHDPAPITTREDQYGLPVTSLIEEHDLTSTQENLDAAPMTMVQDNHDAAAIIMLQDQCDAGPTVRSNWELSVQAEDVIASDIIQVEAERKESSPHDIHDPAHIATPQEIHDAVPVTSLLDEHDLTPTSTQDNLDAAPLNMVEENNDAATSITHQDKCVIGSTVGRNLELSEQAEVAIASDTIQVEAEGKESLPYYNHDPALMTTPQQHQDAGPVASLLDKHNSTPTSIQDNLDAALIDMPQDNHDAATISTPQGNHDAALMATPQDNHDDAVSIATTPEHRDAAPITTQQDNYDAASIATPPEKHDLAPITTAQDCHDLAPVTIIEENHDAVAVIALQDKCHAGLAVRSNLDLSAEQAEDLSDSMLVEAEDKESLPQDEHDLALITTPQQNQDAEPVASLLDKHDSTPIITPTAHRVWSGEETPATTQDNLDATPIMMVKDNHDAASITTPQDEFDAMLTEGDNLELSEQVEALVASNTIRDEAKVKESLLEGNHDPARIARPQKNQYADASLLDQHESSPNTTQDNFVATSISMPQDNHDAAPLTTPQDNHDAAPITTRQENQDTEPIASLPQDNLGAVPMFTPQDNHDAVSIATPTDICDAAPIPTPQDDHDAASIATPQDKHDLTLIGPAHNSHDLAQITMVEVNHDATPVISLQDKCDAVPTVGSNLELSEQAEDVIASNSIQVESESKESLPQDKHDPAVISTPKQNQDAEPVASLLDIHDSTPTTTQDNLDAAPIMMVQDYHDAAPITAHDKYEPALSEGGFLEVSEQAESGMASETMQVEAEDCNVEVSGRAEAGTSSDTVQIKAEGKESSD